MTRSIPVRAAAAGLACVLPLAGWAAPAQAASTGGISGQFVSASKNPIGSAAVAVYESDGAYVDSVQTDDNGRYKITGLAAGTYKLEFNANGLVQWARQKRDGDAADPIAVKSGQVTTVNETQFELGTISGRLVDAAGQPAAWTEVAAAPLGRWESEWVRGYTDDDGRYALHVLPGQYQVAFMPFGGGEQWAPRQRVRDEGAVFTVAVNSEVSVDAELLPYGSLAGKVVDPAGNPVTGIKVAAYDGDILGGLFYTDEEGRYSMAAVFAGQYKLAFELPSNATVWAPHALSKADAETFTVTADTETVVDTTLAVGSIAGRFAKADGTGLGDTGVTVRLGDTLELWTETDKSGNYRIDYVPATEGYLVQFNNWTTNRSQYAYGKDFAAEADRITVAVGKTTTVDDHLTGGGSLRVRAVDASTGAAVKDFCVTLLGPADASGCTKGSELLLSGINPGSYEGHLDSAAGGFYLRGHIDATVRSGQTTTVEVPLTKGGAITSVVTDTATGKPVSGVCVFAVMSTNGLADYTDTCTDAQGKVRVGPLAAGTYTLFARASSDSKYGHQWVGASAGTGNQQNAKKITVKAGKTATSPAVKMDKAGTVAGVVTSAATGKPVSNGYLSFSSWDFGYGPTNGVDIGTDGRYTLTGLGPYDWPLYVVADDHAPQWSGGVGNRFKATPIAVKAGKTTTYSPALVTGTVMRGKVTPAAGELEFVRVTAYNTKTADPIGVGDAYVDGVYEMRVLGSQTVRLRLEWSMVGSEENYRSWYDGASGFADATEVSIPSTGEMALDITLR